MASGPSLRLASDVSVVIATLLDGSALDETVDSLLWGTAVPNEIVVINDGGDVCSELLEARATRRTRVAVRHTARLGVAGARNLGARLATCQYLVFLDAHCRVETDWLTALVDMAATYPSAVIAGALRDHDDDVYGCGGRLVTAELRTRWLTNAKTGEVVPMAPGGCIGLEASLFRRLGGFGPFRELGLEDAEFALRAWRTGVDIRAAPSARASHRFRANPPYSLDPQSRPFNLARLALVHFDGERRHQVLRTLARHPRGGEALVDAMATGWETERQLLAANERRTAEDYFVAFGDW